MTNIKIGILPLYIELYDQLNIDKNDISSHYNHIANLFRKEGFSVETTEPCRLDNEFNRAVKNFEKAKVDVIVTYHFAYSPSLESINALSRTKLPIVVLDTTEAYSLSFNYSNDPVGNNHGIHGVMDMCNLLKRHGKQFAICAGHLFDGKIIKKASNYIRIAVSAMSINGANIGLFGSSFKGMGDFIVTDKEMKDRFNVNLIHVDDKELVSVYKNITEKEIAEEIEKYKNDFIGVENIDEKALKDNIRSCLAIRKIVIKENLSAFSVNFLDVNQKNIKTMPFIECCKEMQNGVGYSGEGDAMTATFAGAIGKTIKDYSFVEIFCPDWKNDKIFISHMGEMNYSVAEEKPVLDLTDFPFTDGDPSLKGYAKFREGKAVYCNVFRDEKENFNLLLSSIDVVSQNPDEYTNRIRGWIKPSMPISDFLEKLSKNGAIHHGFIVYDVDIDTMEYFGELLKMPIIKI